jgi:hypothetical protein
MTRRAYLSRWPNLGGGTITVNFGARTTRKYDQRLRTALSRGVFVSPLCLRRDGSTLCTPSRHALLHELTNRAFLPDERDEELANSLHQLAPTCTNLRLRRPTGVLNRQHSILLITHRGHPDGRLGASRTPSLTEAPVVTEGLNTGAG